MSDEEKKVDVEAVDAEPVSGPASKPKRTRRTKAQMAEARALEMKGLDLQGSPLRYEPVAIASFPPPPPVPSLSPEAKQDIMPETSVRAFLVWWFVFGIWFEHRAVKLCLPLVCVKLTY